MQFHATCPIGVERALADELGELGLERVRIQTAAVRFAGRWEDAWWACLTSRVAMRILHPLVDTACRGPDELYEIARSLEWNEHLSEQTTLAVTAVGNAPGLENTMFVAQRTKDAIVDGLREKIGARPSVDREDPDVRVFVRLHRGRVMIALDVAGESLHRRGYRDPGSPAPVKETLAAALLRMSGWDRTSTLVDPMCGSGTFAIEADLLARNVAPGLARKRFGFERWASTDDSRRRRIERLRERARARAKTEGPRIVASDADSQAVDATRRNAERAGARLDARVARLSELSVDPPATVIANPPYGERLAADRSLFDELDAALAALSGGVRVALLLGPQTPFRPPPYASRYRVRNGALPCTFAVWDRPG